MNFHHLASWVNEQALFMWIGFRSRRWRRNMTLWPSASPAVRAVRLGDPNQGHAQLLRRMPSFDVFAKMWGVLSGFWTRRFNPCFLIFVACSPFGRFALDRRSHMCVEQWANPCWSKLKLQSYRTNLTKKMICFELFWVCDISGQHSPLPWPRVLHVCFVARLTRWCKGRREANHRSASTLAGRLAASWAERERGIFRHQGVGRVSPCFKVACYSSMQLCVAAEHCFFDLKSLAQFSHPTSDGL